MRRSLYKYQKITNLIILVIIERNKRLTISVWSNYYEERKGKKTSRCNCINWGHVKKSIIEVRFNWYK